jgi:hypothetical protein
MGVPSSPNCRRTRPPVDMPLLHRFISSTHYTTIRNDITKNIRVLAHMIPIMAVFLIQSDRSDRITKQSINFAAPLDYRIKKLMGHGSAHVEP